jgi:hypothetical protein
MFARPRRQLRAVRTAMMSTEWAENFKTLPVPQQQDAHRLLFQVHLAILEMENARLADIRDKLVANEKALGEGIASLKDSLKKIQKIAVLMAKDMATAQKAAAAFVQLELKRQGECQD